MSCVLAIRIAPCFCRRGVFWRIFFVFCAVSASAWPSTSYPAGPVGNVPIPAGAVVLVPGIAVQAVVDARPPGTTFLFAPGLYRLQQIVPKDGDRFIGSPGATLNGARPLTGAMRSHELYVFEHQSPDPNTVQRGRCRAEFPRCDRPQALFVSDVPLRAVARLADVRPGAWFFDYDAQRIYLADDPAGHSVEVTYRPFAFGGDARDVRIENLVVEKYASGNQQGAINNEGAGIGWTIINNIIRQNYGYGITLGTGGRASGNNIYSNGELGIGGGNSSGLVVEGNEIAFNVWNGVDCEWECGGAKWGAVSDLTVRDNYVHDNGGDGLWTDERCRNVLYEGNRIEHNVLAGISHEISFAAVIRNNVLRGNGAEKFVWGWHAQIQVQNSSNTEIYGNHIELDPVQGGNGIVVIQQNRGDGFAVSNVFVHDNVIVTRAEHGTLAGWFADFDAEGFRQRNNRFARNHYVISSPQPLPFGWSDNAPVSFDAWQASGADPMGSLVTGHS